MVARAVADAARNLRLEGRKVLVAVSGGIDSTVLLHALHTCREELGLALEVGHVNHGLRGPDSDRDEVAVRRLAARFDLPCRVAAVDPERLRHGRSSRARPTLQEAARRARYDALRSLARESGSGHVATAHNLDDQAETVLLRLLRGSGPEGLAGIPRRSADGVVVRPLLEVSRAEIERHARTEGLTWREDPSNRDPRFGRARLRSGGLPAVAASLNPRWLRAIAGLAEAQRTDAEWIEQLVDQTAARFFRADGVGLEIGREGWNALPDALARRLARRALRVCGGSRDVSRTHLLRMVDFLRRARPGTRLQLPGGLELACERESYRLRGAQLRPALEC